MTVESVSILTVEERRTLAAVCDALLPALEPRGDDAPGLFRLGAGDVSLARSVEHAMTALSARQVRELRLFLRLLESRLFMLASAGRATGFSALAAAEREAALVALANSALPPARTGFQALKRLATFLFYALLAEDGRNPAWGAIGYDPPRVAPGKAPLRLRRVGAPTTLEADVCVVGSGAGGGVVAARLAAAGREVLVLEAGPPDQGPDFDQRELIGMRRLYLDQGTTATRDLGVALLAGSCLGGGTAVNWQTSLRPPDFILEEWADRSGLRWFTEPAFTAALDAVCERLGVGTTESVPNANNAVLERGCLAAGFRAATIPRNARGCDLTQCGYCAFGCRVGGKQSTALTYLADAQSSGRTTIVASCRAMRVRVERGGVAGVDAIASDEETGQRHAVRVHARTVVVAAGAIESPALLLRSGVGHAQLGRNLHLHPTTAVAGRYAEPIRGWIGAPQSVLCDQFARARGNFGYRFETAPIHPGLIALAQPWYGGRDHRSRMQHAAHVAAVIVLTRDRAAGRVRVDREGRAVALYALGRMERALLAEGIANAARVHWDAGASEIHTLHARDHTLRRSAAQRASDIDRYCDRVATLPVHANRCAVFSAHQMGTCRIGADARASVCDDRGQVRGVRGLHVADASLFPASSGVNPMITVMALAHVIGDRVAAG